MKFLVFSDLHHVPGAFMGGDRAAPTPFNRRSLGSNTVFTCKTHQLKVIEKADYRGYC